MTFNQQADSAAAQLKQEMGLQQKLVEVDSNGNPAPPPPPPGSYAAQIREQRKEAEQTEAVNEALTQVSNNADPVGSAPAEEERFTPSENAQRRIQELLNRAKEAENREQMLRSEVTASQEELARLRSRNEAYQQAIVPEVEDSGDDGLRQALAAQKREFEERIKPLAAKARQDDLEKLARKYSGFNLAIHPDLIKMFQDRNPAATMEQAFRAVATDEELSLGTVKPAVVPPTVSPTGAAQPRSIPQPEPTPEEQQASELEQLQSKSRELANLRDPAAQRERDAVIARMIQIRTGMAN